jgi:hypothetical protein
MRLSRVFLAPVGLVLALGSGCAARTDVLQKQVADLKDEVRVLRSEGVVLRERLDALEEAASKPSAASTKPVNPDEPAARASDRPRLEVVRLSPEAEGADGWVTIDPSDPRRASKPAGAPDAPATEIRSERGGAIVQRPAPTSPAPATPAPASASKPGQ